jgi:hypothetical protein
MDIVLETHQRLHKLNITFIFKCLIFLLKSGQIAKTGDKIDPKQLCQ